MRACIPLALLIPFAACDSGSPSEPADAATDSTGASVRTVTCPPGQMPTVTTTNNSSTAVYMPATTTISVGGIVKFVMPSMHNVVPNPLSTTDPGLVVDYGQTACLEFSRSGMYSFRCVSHSFIGTIVVQ